MPGPEREGDIPSDSLLQHPASRPDQSSASRQNREGSGGETPQAEPTKPFNGFKGVFDACPFLGSPLSPSDIPRIYPFEITTKQAIEEGQPWLERLKTFNKQELERRLEAIEKYKRETFPKLREKYRTPQQAELIDYQMEAVRGELRRRGNE